VHEGSELGEIQRDVSSMRVTCELPFELLTSVAPALLFVTLGSRVKSCQTRIYLFQLFTTACADEVAAKPVQITGAQLSGRGPGVRLYCICFCLSR
jgi:hypothetical protein